MKNAKTMACTYVRPSTTAGVTGLRLDELLQEDVSQYASQELRLQTEANRDGLTYGYVKVTGTYDSSSSQAAELQLSLRVRHLEVEQFQTRVHLKQVSEETSKELLTVIVTGVSKIHAKLTTGLQLVGKETSDTTSNLSADCRRQFLHAAFHTPGIQLGLTWMLGNLWTLFNNPQLLVDEHALLGAVNETLQLAEARIDAVMQQPAVRTAILSKQLLGLLQQSQALQKALQSGLPVTPLEAVKLLQQDGAVKEISKRV